MRCGGIGPRRWLRRFRTMTPQPDLGSVVPIRPWQEETASWNRDFSGRGKVRSNRVLPRARSAPEPSSSGISVALAMIEVGRDGKSECTEGTLPQSSPRSLPQSCHATCASVPCWSENKHEVFFVCGKKRIEGTSEIARIRKLSERVQLEILRVKRIGASATSRE